MDLLLITKKHTLMPRVFNVLSSMILSVISIRANYDCKRILMLYSTLYTVYVYTVLCINFALQSFKQNGVLHVFTVVVSFATLARLNFDLCNSFCAAKYHLSLCHNSSNREKKDSFMNIYILQVYALYATKIVSKRVS